MANEIRTALPLEDLVKHIARKRKTLLASDFFKESQLDEDDFLEIRRRWNSHSPVITGGYGGGYYFRWRGKGLVLDPGSTFLQAFQRVDPIAGARAHRMGDINLVVVTHDHVDHLADLCILIALLRQYNKHPDRKHKAPHIIDLILSPGAYALSQTYLAHPSNLPTVKTARVLPDRSISQDQDGRDVLEPNQLGIECLSAEHNEIFGGSTGFGLKITFKHENGQKIVFCDSGDTAYRADLSAQYANADILLLHVGTLEDLGKKSPDRGQHLCYQGVVNILDELNAKGALPKLILLGEWGEEFASPFFRADFTYHIKEATGLQNHAILPVDLGMKIRLKDGNVYCSDADEYVPAEQVVVDDSTGQDIQYRKLMS